LDFWWWLAHVTSPHRAGRYHSASVSPYPVYLPALPTYFTPYLLYLQFLFIYFTRRVLILPTYLPTLLISAFFTVLFTPTLSPTPQHLYTSMNVFPAQFHFFNVTPFYIYMTFFVGLFWFRMNRKRCVGGGGLLGFEVG
jgi:hypothetical protein